MPKFRFQLDGVLKKRRHFEQQRQRELAIRIRHLVECQSDLARLNDTVKQTNDDVRQHHLTGVLDMSFLAAHRRFMLAMQRQATSIAQKIVAAQQQVDVARGALAEAAKARKAIEKLREKRFEQWRDELSRKEATELDEVSAQIRMSQQFDDLSEARAGA